MTQATGKPVGDEPAGDETGSDADVPLDPSAEQDSDTADDHQQRDRYQPL
ncbi:hypothetical protein [Kribbella shirazensis]|uniref:Uncharacterized protein n=1 Tax=Kribbella shirazensis TaxID=1105143 RepID=A0A7X5ZY67_9ACTN|nr:hypothetical protein [Kribbella shirazensis]NIK54305.1 hypothetical protein [Kribbella shirazensis]